MKRTALKRTGFKPKVSAQPGILRTANLGKSAIQPSLLATNKDLAKVKKPRMRKCAICKTPFRPFNALRDKWCSPECGAALGIRLAAAKATKEEYADRAVTRAKLNAMRPRKWHMNALKTELHGFIRERDEGKECISCDTILLKLGRPGGDYDAGHFRSVGSASHMRFLENNIHGQCKYCNDHLTGNPHAYEQGLIKRYGQDYVDVLKADNEIRKYTIDDLITLTRIYKLKRKDLRAARAE